MPKVAFFSSILALLAFPALAGERAVSLSVPGMNCASCPYVVQAAISGVEGVQSVTADANARTAQVVFEDAVTSVDTILAATRNAGYPASVIAADSET
jgi:periplasmic mercuric ion binding protein